jgi:hypothetical protein
MSTITRRESISLLGASALGLSAVPGSLTAADSARKIQSADWVDQLFTQPFVDLDEWRDTPVRHRYVHGGFKGTEALFSIYFPPKEQYEGRFFQPVPAMPGNENTAQTPIGQQPNTNITAENTTIGFAAASGAYLVESNQGKKDKYPTDDRTITGYRASAAVAQYSRVLAAQMYGAHRTYGYAYGGSGGAFKTISFAESTKGIWDGFVPYVVGSPMAIPNMFTVQAHAIRVLKDKLPAIIDAAEPGGNGNMYAGLNKEEREALLEATRFGFPPRTWFAYETLGYGPLGGLIDELVKRDPKYYVEDFWKVPGYLGANPPESLVRARIRHYKTTITKILTSDEVKKIPGLRVTSAAVGTNVVPSAFRFENVPTGELKGATLTLKSGAAAGQLLSASATVGDLVSIDIGPDAFRFVKSIKVGDEVEIDNSIYLAIQTYHRHQVPTADYHTWDQFRGPDGKPLYPQRPVLLGPEFAERAAGSVENGRFTGKMILIESLMDEYAYPWGADWYRSKVKQARGSSLDDSFRLYFTDHAMHGSPAPGPLRTRIVEYTNALQQALRDLAAWVEKGVLPPPNTAYTMVDGQVEVPATAAERKGVQPVVTLTVNGGARIDVAVGKPVAFSGVIEVPPNTGKVVRAEWDFEGAGDYPVVGRIEPTDSSGTRATVKATYSFSKPGTYFVALRAASQRRSDSTVYAQIENLARVRVVVE